MKIIEIREASPFKDLFEIKPEDLEAIQNHMRRFGYDPSHPIVVWKEKGVILDGHTRFHAARELYEEDKLRGGRSKFGVLPVEELSFETEREALEYAIHNQTERRNLSEWDVLKLVEKVDELLPMGGDRRSEEARSSFGFPKPDLSEEGNSEPKSDSRERTAGIVGISTYKVSECRYALHHCDRRTLDLIRGGEKTIHQACQTVRDSEKKSAKKREEERARSEMRSRVSDFLGPALPRSEGKKKAEKRQIDRSNVDTEEVAAELFSDLIPALDRCAPTVEKVKLAVEHLHNSGVDEALFRQPDFRNFLGSRLVSNFLCVLETFGFKIERPEGLPMEEVSKLPFKSIKVHFKTEENVQDFARRLGQRIMPGMKSIWFKRRPTASCARFLNDESCARSTDLEQRDRPSLAGAG